MATALVDISRNVKVIMIMRLTISKDMSAIAVLTCELVDYEEVAHI